MAQVLQGTLLFYVLACDSFILYRMRIVRSHAGASAPAHA
jgi:hypothetical protein